MKRYHSTMYDTTGHSFLSVIGQMREIGFGIDLDGTIKSTNEDQRHFNYGIINRRAITLFDDDNLKGTDKTFKEGIKKLKTLLDKL